jgi:hypothetical protein
VSLRELCLRVAAEIRLPRAAVDERWRQSDGAPGERATAVFESVLLPASPTPLVVAIDRLEAIPAAVRKDLFGLLRSWCDCKA